MLQALRTWSEASDTNSTACVEPGLPWENGLVESFNGRFEDEFLNTELFTTAREGQIQADRWRLGVHLTQAAAAPPGAAA